MTKDTGVAVVGVAKARRRAVGQDIHELASGYFIKLQPVSASLIEEASSKVENPPVPTYFNEMKGREEENPNDPAYVHAVAMADQRRVLAAIDTMIMFGVEVVDEAGNPISIDEQSTNWLGKLRLMHKLGHIDLGKYDLEDELDKDYLFKKYVAVTATDISLISKATGLTEEDIVKAEESFRNSQE